MRRPLTPSSKVTQERLLNPTESDPLDPHLPGGSPYIPILDAALLDVHCGRVELSHKDP